MKWTKKVRESTIERFLRKAVLALGGRCYKFTSPGYAGMPDRIVVMPGRHIWFVELKAPGESPKKLQLIRHKELGNLGFRVRVIDSIEQAKRFLKEIEQYAV